MARALYKKQKKILKNYLKDVVKKGLKLPINIEELPIEVIEQLENIYDYETLYLDIERFLKDVYFDDKYGNGNLLENKISNKIVALLLEREYTDTLKIEYPEYDETNIDFAENDYINDAYELMEKTIDYLISEYDIDFEFPQKGKFLVKGKYIDKNGKEKELYLFFYHGKNSRLKSQVAIANSKNFNKATKINNTNDIEQIMTNYNVPKN